LQTGPWRRWWAATLRILLIAGTGKHRSGIANRLSEGLDSAAYRLKIVVQADEGLERIKAGACELGQLGDEVCRCIAEPLVLSANATLHLGASMGIAGYAEGGGLTSMQELVRQSETAANRAKQQGRNCACLFSSELRELLSDRLALGGRLRQAIVRQEFLLHYPRQVDATDGAIVSVEALVRWNSPEFGLLHPRRFVPVAEDSGLIVSLGLHIVEMACRQARAWQDLGIRDLVVSINVSAAQIQRPAFIEEVQRVIGEVGVDPRMLEFEITESIVMDHAERAVGQLQRLKSLGVNPGARRLRHGPFQPRRPAHLHAGMAEGVENAAQCGYLRRAHCDQRQGCFFCGPVSGDAVPALVQRRYLRPLEAPGDQSERVLLLDDEDNILRSLVRLPRRDGYRILTATSAAEAFDLLATSRVQVTLSHQRVPTVSGTELLSQAKVRYPHTMRIVLSGLTDLASVTDAIKRGAIYEFLTKRWTTTNCVCRCR
jgi:EAL domain-containing protein (putative c-di-GMP-specific phosphodiesterase class I)/CheY-like chemotaxis protein